MVGAVRGLAGPGLERKFGGGVPASREDIMVDASPWRVAGILEHTTSGQALEFFADQLLPQDEVIFGHKICEASGQAVWEALALLIALRLWAKFMKGRKVRLRVRSDSTAALRLATRMASPTPELNGLGAEMARTLDLFQLEELFTEHVPGKRNVRGQGTIDKRNIAPIPPGRL